METQLAADQATVKADREVLVQAGSPNLTAAQLQQDSLQVQQAQTALSNANAALTSAEDSGKADVAEAQSAVTSAQSQDASDSATYAQACPNGPVVPDASLTGAQLQAAQSSFTHCQNLQLTLNQDQGAVSKAQAQLPVTQAQAQGSSTPRRQRSTVLRPPSTWPTTSRRCSPPLGSASSQAQAQANLNQAEAQLAQVQSEVSAASLVAPNAGVVTAVYGAAGETLGPDGVHMYQSPAAIPANQSSGFTLFPSQPTSQGASTSGQSGSEPLIELVGGQQQIMAQIPETQVASVQVGKQATVSISALNLTASGVVAQLGLSPNRGSNGVTYDVIVDLNRVVSGLLPGMTATVVF